MVLMVMGMKAQGKNGCGAEERNFVGLTPDQMCEIQQGGEKHFVVCLQCRQKEGMRGWGRNDSMSCERWVFGESSPWSVYFIKKHFLSFSFVFGRSGQNLHLVHEYIPYQREKKSETMIK